jgi:2-polyprenyl-6-hydroxyphenyl methylase/3-demethylubiquinone-9 3-methyltransferase
MSDIAVGPSIEPADVNRFAAIASAWWDPHGKFAPLHRFNPVRLEFIRQEALERFARRSDAAAPFEGLALLDIGCGGGLLSEPMTRLGFRVTGVDASERNIEVARTHAQSLGLGIDYRCATAEGLLEEQSGPFDVVLNMEVIEHVADPRRYLIDCSRLLAPGGLMVLGTLNRTLKALALAKVGAEYVLGWLPRGAHDWRKFLKPEEIRGFLTQEPLEIQGPYGVSFDPLGGRWSQSSDCSINYMMLIKKPALGDLA